MNLFCCGCQKDVEPRLTNGAEVYSHRPDLHKLPFWKCDECNNFVGCHYKTSNPTRPLGVIPTPEIKNARRHIHMLLDPIWKQGIISRKQMYSIISEKLGFKYHTANIRSISDARNIYRVIQEIKSSH